VEVLVGVVFAPGAKYAFSIAKLIDVQLHPAK
jgi:hypothetical protein